MTIEQKYKHPGTLGKLIKVVGIVLVLWFSPPLADRASENILVRSLIVAACAGVWWCVYEGARSALDRRHGPDDESSPA